MKYTKIALLIGLTACNATWADTPDSAIVITSINTTPPAAVDLLALNNDYTGEAAQMLAEGYGKTMAGKFRLKEDSQKMLIQAFMDEQKHIEAAAYFMSLYDSEKGKAKAIALYPEFDADTRMAILLYAPAAWLAKFVKEQTEANATWPTAKGMPGEACVNLQEEIVVKEEEGFYFKDPAIMGRKQEATAFFPMDVNRCAEKAKDTSSLTLLKSLHDLKEFAGKNHQEAALAKFVAVFSAFYYGEENTESVQAAFKARLTELQNEFEIQMPPVEFFRPLEKLGKDSPRLQWLSKFGTLETSINPEGWRSSCIQGTSAVESSSGSGYTYYKCYYRPSRLTEESIAELAKVYAAEGKDLLREAQQIDRLLADVIVHLPAANEEYIAETALLNDIEEVAPELLERILNQHSAPVCNAFETKGLESNLSDEAYNRIFERCFEHAKSTIVNAFSASKGLENEVLQITVEEIQ